ncbi:hypothetical protein K8I31_06340, partial [bacterium]|nr:hypothetical protein [bacterium]
MEKSKILCSINSDMRKIIFQSLTILAFNIVLSGLALASFILGFFRGDPYFAAVPAILALPGIIIQPWFIAFFLLPFGLFLAPFLTTAIS